MKKWTIRGRIAVSFAVILTLMMVMAGVAYTHLIRIEELSSDIDADSLPGLNGSSRILVDELANYSLTEQYALQPDVAIKRKLKAAILASRDYTATLFAQYTTTIETPKTEVCSSRTSARRFCIGQRRICFWPLAWTRRATTNCQSDRRGSPSQIRGHAGGW